MKLRPIDVFSQDELEQVYNGSLEVLERAGVYVELEPVLKMLDQAGASVDYESKIARLPRALVEECLKSVPRQFKLKSRGTELIVGGEDTYWGLICGPTIIDPYSGEARQTTLQDVADWARVGDALENISFLTPPMATDVPPFIADRFEFEAMLNNSGKLLQPNLYSAEGCEDVYEMACIAAGGEDEFRESPGFVGGGCVISPLQHCGMALGAWLSLIPKGVPSFVATESIAGGTAPVTLAGAFVVALADVMSGVAITQLIKRGAPVMWSIGLSHILDMKHLEGLTGAAERAFYLSANTQLSRYAGIPSWSGTTTDSKCLDAQAGYEEALGFLMIQLCQSNWVMAVGGTLASKGISFEAAVFENELIGMVKRIQRGVEVNRDTMAVDLICERGPGGNFTASRHTLKYYKTEYQHAEVTNRESIGEWRKKGSKDLAQVAREKALRILKEYRPEPLPEDIQEQVHAVVQRAEKNLVAMP
jgi:trimethylamine--corrinoid protein Co-methyltransferase